MLARHFVLIAIRSAKARKLLRHRWSACYGFRLNPSPYCSVSENPPVSVCTRKANLCLEHFLYNLFFSVPVLVLLQAAAAAQNPSHQTKPDIPPQDEIWYHSVTEDNNADIKTQEGKFYGVSGTAPAKIITSPGILTTSNPFYFQAQWAERIKDRYVLH